MQHISTILDEVMIEQAQRRYHYLKHIETILGTDLLSNKEREEYQAVKSYLESKKILCDA